MNFLRTTSTRRLIAGAALTVAVVAGGVAVAAASGSGGSSATRRSRSTSPSTTRSPRPSPPGVTARIQLHEQPHLERRPHHAAPRSCPAPPGGSGSRAAACGSSCSPTRATRRSPRRRPPVDLRRVQQHRLPRRASARRDATADAGHGRPRPAERHPDRLVPAAARRAGDGIGRAADDAGRTARVQGLRSRPSTTPGCSARPSSPGTPPTASRCASPSPPPAAARRCSRSR